MKRKQESQETIEWPELDYTMAQNSVITITQRVDKYSGGGDTHIHLNDGLLAPKGYHINDALSFVHDYGFTIAFCTQSSHQNKYKSTVITTWTCIGK